MPEPSEFHRRAVETFELMMTLCRRVGTTLMLSGLLLWIGEFAWLREARSGFPVWINFIRQITCQFGLYLLGMAYLFPRIFPAYRKPVSDMDKREYRRFLYEFGRPFKELLRDILVMAAPMILPVIVVAAAIIAGRVWPEQQRMIMGIAILAGFASMVGAVWIAANRQRGAVDRWYAEQFPSENK